MFLALSVGDEIQDPSDAQIEQALRGLPDDPGAWAMLARSQKSYVEATGSVSQGFFLEYRARSRHYRSKNTSLDLTEVIEAFRAFRQGDTQYLSQLAWERENYIILGGSVILGGMVLLVGRLLHLRLLQATGMVLTTFALGLWTWKDLRTGEIYVRAGDSYSYTSRRREPVGYWVLISLKVLATAIAVWVTVRVLRGSMTIP